MMYPGQDGTMKEVYRNALDYLGKAGSGFVSLLQGMGVTIRYFIDPRKIITQQYPENRETLQMMDRFRGHLVLVHDENNTHSCTACGMCERACPNGTISVLPTKDIGGKKILGLYIYRLAQCTLCNLCVESCPYGAIAMGRDFELAVYDRRQLTMILNNKEETNDA